MGAQRLRRGPSSVCRTRRRARPFPWWKTGAPWCWTPPPPTAPPGLGLRPAGTGKGGAGRHPRLPPRGRARLPTPAALSPWSRRSSGKGCSPRRRRFPCTSLTGYSGGGKKMIADYREKGAAYDPPRPYGLAQAAQAPAGDGRRSAALPRRRCFCPSSAIFTAACSSACPCTARSFCMARAWKTCAPYIKTTIPARSWRIGRRFPRTALPPPGCSPARTAC